MIPGCQLWLDGNDASTFTLSGSNVTQWRDKSGNSNHMSNNGTSPIYKSSLINTFGAIDCTNGGALISSGFQNSASVSFAMVAVVKTGVGTWGSFFTHGSRDTDFSIERNSIVGTTIHLQTANDNSQCGLTYTEEAPVVYYGTMTSGTSRFFESFCAGTRTTTTGTNSSSISVGSQIARIGKSDNNEVCNSYIGEIIYYTLVLNSTQQAQIEAYLTQKWGLVSSLPTGHIGLSSVFYKMPPFAPFQLPGCQVWLDGADPLGTGTAPSSGTVLSTWFDKSGNGYNAVASATGPTYTSNAFNGLAAPVFADTELYTSSYTISSTNKLSAFLVLNPTSFSGTVYNADFLYTFSDYRIFDLYISTAGGQTNPPLVLGINSVGGYFATGSIIGSHALLSTTSDASSFLTYLDGTLVNTTALGSITYSMNQSSQWRIGLRYYGIIAEIIIFNTSLTTSQRQQVESYLAQKWDILGNLSAGHPGYSSIIYKVPTNAVVTKLVFDPTQLSGLLLWLDGSKETGANGSSVASLTDRSGKGYNCSPTATITVAASFLGGKSVYNFGTSRASVNNFPWQTSFTHIVLVKCNSGQWISTLWLSGNYHAYIFAGNWNLINVTTTSFGVNDSSIAQGTSVFSSASGGASSWVIFSLGYQWGKTVVSNYSINGTVRTSQSGTAQTAQLSSSGTLYLNGNGNSGFDTSYVAEVIHYNSVLSTADRQKVEGYLAQKWGLTANLPATHPGYKATLVKSVSTIPTTTLFKPTQIAGCQLWLDASDATTMTGVVTTAFTETFSNAGVPTNAFSGNGVANGTTYAYLVGNASFSPYLTLANWTWSGTYSGISYGDSPFVINPTSPVSGSLGYSAFIQVNHNATPSIIYRTTTIPGGVSCTVSFWYCARDSAASPLSLSVSYGTQAVVTINKPFVANVWTNSTTTFITNATNQNLTFTVASDTSNSYYGGDQTANIAYVRVTYTGVIDTIGFSLAAWLDKSSNAYNFNQLAGAPVGFTATNAIIGTPINGKRTLYFDEGASIKQSSTIDGVKNFFWVSRISSVGSGRNYFLLGHDTHYDWHSQVYPGKFCEVVSVCPAGIRDASPSALYTSDAAATTNAAFSAINFPTAPAISILSVSGITGTTRFQGVCYDRGADHIGWCGDLAEVITFSTALTTFQHQQVESYLAQKWGLTTNLPSSHPSFTGLTLYLAPKYIGGISVWFDGADPAGTGVIPANGATVSQWVDKSGNANSTTAAIGTNTYDSTRKSIKFSGSSYYTLPNGTISSGSANFTIFVVCRPTNIGGYSYVYFAGNGSAGQATALIFYPDGQIENGFWTDYLGIASAGSVAINNSYMFTSFYNGTRTLYRNGTSIVTGTPTVSKNTASANNCIGSINGSTLFYGTISELIVFNVALDTTTRQGIEAYLAQKWELTPNLAASHPGLSVTYSQSQKFALIGLNYYVDAGIATSYSGSGSTWYDLAGSGINMTLYNSPTYSSANGGYISFVPSSSQYAQSSAGLPLLPRWTVEVWHYYNATNTGVGATIVGEVFGGNLNYNLGASDNGNTNLSATVITLSGGWYRSSGYSLPSVGWYHIVGIYDGSFRKLYVNGVLVASDATSVTLATDGLGFRFMRRWDSAYADYWGGFLATVRIYATALTAGQIATNFNNSKSRFGFF